MPTTSRDPAAAPQFVISPEDKARGALALMIEALELIDASEGASVAGAHLDLAIHRLTEWLESKPR